MCAVSLPSLIAFDYISCNLCADSDFGMAAVNDGSVCAGGFLWFPPPYLVAYYIYKYSRLLYTGRLTILTAGRTLKVFISRNGRETAYMVGAVVGNIVVRGALKMTRPLASL